MKTEMIYSFLITVSSILACLVSVVKAFNIIQIWLVRVDIFALLLSGSKKKHSLSALSVMIIID